jgi:DNA-directed RNA polymerase specialized sigma24 family protein
MNRPSDKYIDAQYAAYLSGSITLDALLSIVNAKAVWVLKDDDAAQEFTIETWQHLPIPVSSLAWWLRGRLYWRQRDLYRQLKDNKEVPISHVISPYSEESTEDKLDELHLKAKGNDTPSDRRLDSLDPFWHKVAGLLEVGFTQEETAEKLGIKPATLRKRLERLRSK